MLQEIAASEPETVKKENLPKELFYYFYHLEDRDLSLFQQNWRSLNAYDFSNSKTVVNILGGALRGFSYHQNKRSEGIGDAINFLKDNIDIWEGEALKKIGTFDSQVLTNTLCFSAKLGVKLSPEFLQLWSDQAVKKIETFNAKELSNSFWAHGKLKKDMPPKLLQLWENQVIKKIETFNAKDFLGSFLSYAQLGIEPSSEFLQVWENQVINHFDSFSAQNLTDILWAYATLGIEPSSEFMQGWEDQVLNKKDSPSSEVVRNLWSLAVIDSLSNNPDRRKGYKDVYEQLRSHIEEKEVSTFPKQKQVYDSDIWFRGKSSISNPIETGKTSGLEINLKDAFDDADLTVNDERGVIKELPKAVDFSIEKNGVVLLVEVDGPTHFIRNLRTGEVRHNGATLFRSALMHKLAPEEKILRIGYEQARETLREEGNIQQAFCNGVFAHFTQQSPGVYAFQRVGDEDQIISLLSSKPAP